MLSERVQLCFFFQAEDGIRDHCVTGVQTCALPIYRRVRGRGRRRSRCDLGVRRGAGDLRGGQGDRGGGATARSALPRAQGEGPGRGAPRSEERRVGKEWRARVAAYHGTENTKARTI